MDKQKAYVTLAQWFEYLNDDCGYENWSQYFIAKLRAYPVRVGLDVGCGGGWFTRAFARAGYQMTGMDISAEMLDTAQRNAMQQGVRGEYLLGDITRKKLPKRFDFVTAINDCINYIPKDKLSAAFKNVGGALKKGGVFLFDISSKRKYQQKLNGTVSADDREDITYLAFNQVNGDTVTIDVTLFVKGRDNKFERFDERHVQYVYEENEIVQALHANGFVVQGVEGHLGEDKTQSDRLLFTAVKQ